MEKDTTHNFVFSSISEVINISKEKINIKDRLLEDLKIDSLSSVELIVKIEDELSISLDEFNLTKIITVEDLIELIKNAKR